MQRGLLVFALAFSFQASAYLTAPADKPDPYARRHYTAADLPAAKKMASLKKAKKQKDAGDDDIAAEIAREDAGSTPVVEKPKKVKVVAPKAVETEAKQELKHDCPNAVSVEKPASSHAMVAVCRVKQKKATNRYLISDSDGYEACSERGGEAVAGNEDDRTLTNVKDAAVLKRARK